MHFSDFVGARCRFEIPSKFDAHHGQILGGSQKVDQISDFEWCIQQILWKALPFQNLVHFSDSQSLESIFQKMLSKNEICFFGLTTWIRFQILTIWGLSNFRKIFDLCTIDPGTNSFLRLCTTRVLVYYYYYYY